MTIPLCAQYYVIIRSMKILFMILSVFSTNLLSMNLKENDLFQTNSE